MEIDTLERRTTNYGESCSDKRVKLKRGGFGLVTHDTGTTNRSDQLFKQTSKQTTDNTTESVQQEEAMEKGSTKYISAYLVLLPHLTFRRSEHETITTIAPLSDDTVVSCADEDSTIRVWSLKTGNCISTFHMAPNPLFRNVSCCAVLSSCEVAYVDINGLHILDISTNSVVASFADEPNAAAEWCGANSIRTVHRGTHLVTCDKTLKVWSISERKCVQTINCCIQARSLITCATELSDGCLVVGGLFGILQVFRPRVKGKHLRYELRRDLRQEQRSIGCVTELTDGLVAIAEDSVIKLWDAKTWKCLRQIACDEPTKAIVDVGSGIVLTTEEWYLKVWTVDDWQCVNKLVLPTTSHHFLWKLRDGSILYGGENCRFFCVSKTWMSRFGKQEELHTM